MIFKGQRFDYFKEIDNFIWYIPKTEGGLYKKNLETGEESFVYMPVDDALIISGNCTFNYILFVEDEIWMIPRYAKKIVVWNRKSNHSFAISFPERPRRNGEYFLCALQTLENVILIPSSYQGIVYINKTTKEALLENQFFLEYKKILLRNDMKEGLFVFRSNISKIGETFYIPFYNVNKVLKYDYVTKSYKIINTEKVKEGVEWCVDGNVKLLIFNKVCCVRVDNTFAFADKMIEAIAEDKLFRIYVYEDFVFIFTERKIYVFDNKRNEYIEDELIVEINDTYSRRWYVRDYEDYEDYEDTLYVFEENNVLNITYDIYGVENLKILLRVSGRKFKVYKYELLFLNQEQVLLLSINQKMKNSVHKSNVGEIIYKNLN